MKSPTAGSRLFRKYVVVLLVLVGGVLMASSLVELYFAYRETQGAIVRVERAKAVAAAARIEQFLKEVELQVRETTRTASDDPDASQVGPAKLGFRGGLGAALAEQRELDFLRVLRNVSAIGELSHLDLAGKEQLRVSRLEPDIVGSQEDFSRAPKFVEARAGKTYWSPVYLKNESEPYATLAVPSGKHAVEVTTAEVSLGAVLKIVSQIEVGSGGYAYVVDSRNHLVAHPDSLVLRAKRDLSTLVQVKAARADRSGSAAEAVVADGLGGERVLAAHAGITPVGWLVFVERAAADAYAPLRAPIMRSVIIFVLGLGLSVLASILLARRMVAPIRVLQEGAARIGAGDLGHRIDVRTGDELEALGDELNRTAGQLEASHANLEAKVEERTRELAAANAGLTEALDQLRALGEVGQAVSSTLDLETVLTTIVGRANQLAGTDSCTVYEYDEQTEELLMRATHNLDEEVVAVARRAPIRRGEGVAGHMAVTHEPIQIPDIAEAGAYHGPLRDVLLRTGTRALLGIPLLHKGHLIGGAHRQQEDARGILRRGHRPPQDLRQPVGPGHPECASLPRSRRRAARRRDGQRGQERVPGHDESRDPDPDECGDRDERPPAEYRADRRAARVRGDRPLERGCPAHRHQRRAGLQQDRGGADGPRGPAVRPARGRGVGARSRLGGGGREGPRSRLPDLRRHAGGDRG